MKIVVDKMPEKMEDCPRRYVEENGVGDKWDACNMGQLHCIGVEKCPFYIGFDEVMKGNIKAVDAVPVIRCKDCKWYERDKQKGGFCRKPEASMWSPGLPIDELKPDDYCSRAQRRENINGD